MAPLPESGTTPVATAPPAERIREDGHLDGPRPRWIEIRVGELAFGAWCREGVWTPLDRRRPTSFVVRESWSRLGGRAPRRLSRVRDAVWNGALARLRPTSNGELDFIVELFEASVAKGAEQSWQGETIRLPIPEQRSYRFEGRVPAGHDGAIARWGNLEVALRDAVEAKGAAELTRFSHGFVAGARAAYEERTWTLLDPVERDYDGVLQAVFRLEMTRKAAGIRDGQAFGGGIQLDG